MLKNKKEFLVEYNNLISNIKKDHLLNYHANASPTLNKQETISFLYKSILKNKLPKKSNKLKFIIKFIYFFLFFILYNFFYRNKLIKSNFKDLTLLRTWLVKKSINKNNIIDEYFGELNSFYKERKIQTLTIFYPLKFDKLIFKFNKINKNDNYILSLDLLNIYDIFYLFFRYFFSRRLKIKKTYKFKGKIINKNLNFCIKNDFYEFHSFQYFIEDIISRKLNTMNFKKIIYVFENQSWEKIFNKNLKSTNTIGYQSSGFSLKFLNFFPSSIDSKIDSYPNKIFTVGDIFTKFLLEYGNYKIPIETSCALRFKYEHLNNKFIVNNYKSKYFKRILYCFSVNLADYSKICYYLSKVFSNSTIEVVLKIHPLYDPNVINEFKMPSNFSLYDHSKHNDLSNTFDFALFNDNSFGIESLIMGLKSYELCVDDIYEDSRLFYFDEYKYKINILDLEVLKNSLERNSLNKSFNIKNIENYLSKLYRPTTLNNIYKFLE